MHLHIEEASHNVLEAAVSRGHGLVVGGRGLLLLHQLQQRGGGGGGGGVIQPAVPGPPPALAQLAVHAALAQVEVAEEAAEPEQECEDISAR